jgi:hypothetical protein
VNWLEYSEGDEKTQVIAALEMMQQALTIKKSAALAKINIGHFCSLAAAEGQKVRFVFAPISGNPGHSEIRHLPPDDDELLDLLASDGIQSWFACTDLIE